MTSSKRVRRFSVLSAMGTVTAAVALGVATIGPANAEKDSRSAASGPKPTVVLVHGAFADGSSWNGVIGRLKRDGYPVVAPANPLRGLSSDAAYLKDLLNSVKGPIVLAGHSYGGSVISAAAAGDKDVKALVYIAAFLPETGESASGLSGKFPGSTLGPTLHEVTTALADGTEVTDLSITQDKFHQQFAADVPAATAGAMAAGQRPITSAALDEKLSGEPAWKTVPSWTMITTQDLNIPVKAQRFMADRAGSHKVEIKASHAVTVSQPGAVTRLIEQAAHATGSGR
ncbi:alpha/beta hydrolase [Streptomyces sp. NPDC006923]|uniref:alpha/beta fold hydrolase n=1 Tax=Streptomyces sp. NPDC006923 TaxID=3155355 RepID=UPI0033FDF652